MTDEVFADRFGDITVTGTTIRIDLVSQSPTERDTEGQPAMRFRQRIVLPVEGFLRSQDMMRRMLDVLIEQGIVQRSEGADAEQAEPNSAATRPASPQGAGPQVVASPNFPRRGEPG